LAVNDNEGKLSKEVIDDTITLLSNKLGSIRKYNAKGYYYLITNEILINIDYSKQYYKPKTIWAYYGIWTKAKFEQLRQSFGDKFFLIFIFGDSKTIFIIPSAVIEKTFKNSPTAQKGDWKAKIRKINDEYEIFASNAKPASITQYLNNFDLIRIQQTDSVMKDQRTSESHIDLQEEAEKMVFVTGYDQSNLDISKKTEILGWTKNSNFLSKGSLVFVFNRSTLTLDSCFEVESKYKDDQNLIWADEINSDKVIYPNRWNAQLVQNRIAISLKDINKISPFDKEPFQGLLRGNFPMPINSPQNMEKYKDLRKLLLNSIQNSTNYWIFVVTDQGNLTAEKIYHTRMGDKFWGISEHTGNRKHLKKGDKVIFSHGARAFLGLATVDSNSFELDQIQKNKFEHEHEVFKTDYGVLLSDIVSWLEPKKIENYVDRISYIKNKPNYRHYFEGGIKRISKEDYLKISEDINYKNEINAPTNKIEAFEDAPLEFPSQSRIDVAIDKISQTLLVNKKTIMQVVISILSGRHIILAGPVGTGKTTLAKLVGELFWETDIYNGYYSEIYTATAEWSSYEVIGGMVPRIRNSQPTYEIAMGCVSETVLDNWSEPPAARIPTIKGNRKFKGTWLIIDEFNRADIDKVFGQLFTSLETRVLRVPVIEGSEIFEDVKIPLDYRIICTLNTADKHYLFKLSDALKRRFAYIELFPPSREDREKEIYYALKNGLNELAIDFSNLVVLNSDTKTIDLERTDKNMLLVINQAYDIFDVARMVKPLGTAILKSIYQSLVVGVKLTNDYDESLDTSINSNLVPQLESMNVTSLECVFYFLFGNAVEFFKQKHEGNDRDQYQTDFSYFLKFINADANKQEGWSRQFLEKIDNSTWDSLWKSYSQYKKEIKCPLFKTSLQDLVKVSLI